MFGPDLRYVHVAGAAFFRVGWKPEELVGRRPSEILEGPEGLALDDHLRAALDGETRHHEHTGFRDAGAVWKSTIAPLRDASGAVMGGMVISRDVGPVRLAERASRRRAEEAAESARIAERERWQRERLEFLTEINRVIADCSDRRDVMREVTRASVPRLGDWCSMYVFMHPDDPLPALEVAHVDPKMVAYAYELQQRMPYDPNSPRGAAHVIRTGQPQLYPEITDELLAELRMPADVVEAVRRLGLRSSITVPLVKRHRVIGAMQFVVANGGRRYGGDDLTLAMALAGRVASALDNRELAERQHEIAHTLQRSLLPQMLPKIPGADVAVRYWAAGEGTEVGGDFYDVFAINKARHAVVIGDVCGSGPSAAAVTAMVRHNIHANAWHGDDHASVLRHLNHAMVQTWPDTLCTVAYATVTAVATGLELTLTIAGHPLPILVRRDGKTKPIGHPGLLLGVFDTVQHRASRVEMLEGDTVVLYTDGATDLRPPKWLMQDEFTDMVAQSVTSVPDAETGVERLSAALEAHVPFSDRNDDIALVVIRALPPIIGN